jgi:F-type H+-transporting ATPase subunit a
MMRFALAMLLCLAFVPLSAQEGGKKDSLDIKKEIFGHIQDSYEWPITVIDGKPVKVTLPCILLSRTGRGLHAFSFGEFARHGGTYEGFRIAPAGSRYEGKIVEVIPGGWQVRPFDMSITKMTLAVMINGLLLIALILGTSHWYRKHKDERKAPGGFIGFMEMFIMMVEDDIVKECVGPSYRKFSPYLLTAFFFIFLSNVMGLLPFFPGGISINSNIAITLVLALFTFAITNIFGTKHYWKDIFWPDVPVWLKVPLMPIIEIVGMLTKPFSLMVRLFGNMLAGHMGLLIVTLLIFIGASISPVLAGAMSVVSVLFNIFMSLLELLVAFIQAYVFTMLSSIFIGIAQGGSKNGAEQDTGLIRK